MPLPQLDFKASEAARAALAMIGRTEDVRFSPDNKLLAIAGFGRHRCLILRIEIERTAAGPAVAIGDFMELTSDGIGDVHGLDFLDDRTLVTANRDGLVSIVRLPSGELAGRRCSVEADRHLRGGIFCRLETPGSVAVRHEPRGLASLLVCNNYTHQVTRHLIRSGPPYRVWRNQVLLRQGLIIPDGIALSHDGRWIAVSSHGTNDIKIFDASAALGPSTLPAGVLRSANYPHGLRFTNDDRHIVVADAGSPELYVYDRGEDWRGPRDPSRRIRVLDDETFHRGRANIEEGGPKGLDIDRSNTVVAVTCEEQSLAFYPLASIVGKQPRISGALALTGQLRG